MPSRRSSAGTALAGSADWQRFTNSHSLGHLASSSVAHLADTRPYRVDVSSHICEHAARLVEFGEILQFLGIKFHGQCLDCILQMTLFTGADDGRRDAGLMKNPRKCDLRVIDAALFCSLRHPVHNREIFGPVVLLA